MVMKFLHLALTGPWEQGYQVSFYFYILKEGCQIIQPETPQNLVLLLHSVSLRSPARQAQRHLLGCLGHLLPPSTEPSTASRNFYSLWQSLL